MKDLMYFPTNIEEVEEYVEQVLNKHLHEHYESEKMLLHSLITTMFYSDVPRDEINPYTLRQLLQSVPHEDDEGLTLVDKLYMGTNNKAINGSVEAIYWFLRGTPNFINVVTRLLSIYQFYEKEFKEPVFSNDKKTLLFYPPFQKNKTYTIPNGTERIAGYAFTNNPYINYIKIPSTVKEIYHMAFHKLPNIKGFIVDVENEYFFSDFGVLFQRAEDKCRRVLLKYPCAAKESKYIIEENVQNVLPFAFENCNNLKEIALVSHETCLSDSAFCGCSNLSYITVLNSENDSRDKLNPKAFNDMFMGNSQIDEGYTEYEETAPDKNRADGVLEYRTPSQIKTMFDDFIVGHDEAKKTLSVAVYSHILRCNNKNSGIGKSNIIMCGPTGCGKTEFARTIARGLDVPFVTADATSITETGMKGNDPTDMLKDLLIMANDDLERAQKGIIYIDEIDKLASYGENSHRESYSKGVQQSLLRIIEGGIIPLRIETPMSHYTINFDTSNVLFIVGGAFGNLTSNHILDKKKGIGFTRDSVQETVEKKEEKKLEAKDFVKYGMTQEFMGRFPVIVQLSELTENEIYKIMIEPKNSVVSQYKNLVNCIGSELVFEDELLKSIAANAVKTGTGARGIRTIIEKLVENVIFELPDKKDVKQVVVHKGMLNQEEARYIE